MRPSAGIGVVEVQKLEVFRLLVGARATLCGDRRGRGAKTQGFLRFCGARMNPLRGSGAKTRVFCVFFAVLSAWSRCKNSSFFLGVFACELGNCLVVCASRAVAGSIPAWPRQLWLQNREL